MSEAMLELGLNEKDVLHGGDTLTEGPGFISRSRSPTSLVMQPQLCEWSRGRGRRASTGKIVEASKAIACSEVSSTVLFPKWTPTRSRRST